MATSCTPRPHTLVVPTGGDVSLEDLVGEWRGEWCSDNPINFFACGGVKMLTYREGQRVIGTCELTGPTLLPTCQIEAKINDNGQVMWGAAFGSKAKASFKGYIVENNFSGRYTLRSWLTWDYGRFSMNRVR